MFGYILQKKNDFYQFIVENNNQFYLPNVKATWSSFSFKIILTLNLRSQKWCQALANHFQNTSTRTFGVSY